MRLTKGTRVGPYEVLSALGSGGMAEVYRARDTRLGRDIAIKVVNEALAADPELVRRFDQEARLAGSLNHPNLVAVFDVGIHEGVPFFVTELLKGESLRQRLEGGPIPVDTALDWAGQLAEGLAAAHARGIIHRDVKPENAFVTADGHVKLLDFGIAKLAEGQHPATPRGLLDDTLTPTGHGTKTGAILGTPAYMSPEQVQGGRVDARTDVFSLGAVLHEMISGKRPFSGASTLERAHAIVHEEPALLPTAPPLVAQVVRRCLAKDPDARFQSARDLAFALEMLRGEPQPKLASSPSKSRARVGARWWVAVGILAALVTAGILLPRLRPATAPAPSSISIETVTLRKTRVIGARFTPDGRVVFSAQDGPGFEMFERNLTSSSVQPLGQKNVILASISPRGEFAVLLPPLRAAMGLTAGPLARVAAGGGTPRVVAEEIVSADWAPSGELAVIRRAPGVYTVEYPIGKVLFKSTGREWLGALRVSPGGDLLAFMRHPTEGFIGGDVLIVDLQGKTRAVSKVWGRADGVAWPSQKEVWFAAGEKLPNQLQALPLDGPERTVYSSIVAFFLCDVAKDGTALVYVGQLKTENRLSSRRDVGRALAGLDRPELVPAPDPGRRGRALLGLRPSRGRSDAAAEVERNPASGPRGGNRDGSLSGRAVGPSRGRGGADHGADGGGNTEVRSVPWDLVRGRPLGRERASRGGPGARTHGSRVSPLFGEHERREHLSAVRRAARGPHPGNFSGSAAGRCPRQNEPSGDSSAGWWKSGDSLGAGELDPGRVGQQRRALAGSGAGNGPSGD